MPATPLTLLSDFNIEPLARALRAAGGIDATAAGFGAVQTELLRIADRDDTSPETLVVWTLPEGVIAGFAEARGLAPHDRDAVLAEVDVFAGLIARAAARCRAVFVANWVMPRAARGLGPLDHRPGLGIRHLLDAMNLRLAEALEATPNAYVLDTERWIAAAGGDAAWSPKLMAAAKQPFAAPVFRAATTDIAAALDGMAGDARKLVILDLDNTLWGGVVGETGWEGIALGGHSLKGEAFLAFQRRLKALTRRGIVLALASKNDEAVALEAITRHPDMALTRDDFAGWRIDWNDKAENIRALLADLNLGPRHAVFIDDNPAERGRVAEAFPDMLVPDWPADPTLYASALDALPCFDTVSLTDEDRARAKSYAAERGRRAAAQNQSPEAWLESLAVTIRAEPLDAGNLTRAAQLLNKTNQMNLRTRRMTSEELMAWANAPARACFTFRVADRFGDYGLTGLASAEMDGRIARVTDFLLSCRVMGRRLEHAMTRELAEWARTHGAETLVAEFIPTERNRPCRDYWDASGFTAEGDTYTWDLAEPYPAPSLVTLDTARDAA